MKPIPTRAATFDELSPCKEGQLVFFSPGTGYDTGMRPTGLEQSIIKTLAYFDIFNYPLTATEIWKFLYRPDAPAPERRLLAISEALATSPYLASRCSGVEGFYCLRGREDLIPARKRRNNRVDHQMRKVARMVKLLRFSHSIKMIGIISSLPLGNVKEGSDIDLFIVARKNSIWRARLFAAGLLKLLHQRPDARVSKDRFCLSFFITEDALNLERAAFGPDDIVFQYYVQSIVPVYDPDGIYPKLLAANSWLLKHLPNSAFEQRSIAEVKRPLWLLALHRMIAFLSWPLFNSIAPDWHCNVQLKILPQRLKSIANIDSRVIISDIMLKFHDKDNRHEIYKLWQERVAQHI